jgi:hypothetical protein
LLTIKCYDLGKEGKMRENSVVLMWLILMAVGDILGKSTWIILGVAVILSITLLVGRKYAH